MNPLRLSIPATSANIRMFYYIGNSKDTAVRGFDQLRWLLTDVRSGWENLSDDDRIALLKHTREIFNEVFVFV